MGAFGTPPPSGPDAGSGGDASPAGGGMVQMAGNQDFLDPAKKLAKMAADAKDFAESSPASAPMMREIQNQVRQATMKLMQTHMASQQPTPQI